MASLLVISALQLLSLSNAHLILYLNLLHSSTRRVRSRSPAASGRPGSPTGNSASTSTSAPYPTSRRDGSDGSMFRSRGGKPAAPTVPDCNPATPLSAAQRNWLHNRGISEEAIAANALFAERGGEGGEGVYCPMLGVRLASVYFILFVMQDAKNFFIVLRSCTRIFFFL